MVLTVIQILRKRENPVTGRVNPKDRYHKLASLTDRRRSRALFLFVSTLIRNIKNRSPSATNRNLPSGRGKENNEPKAGALFIIHEATDFWNSITIFRTRGANPLGPRSLLWSLLVYRLKHHQVMLEEPSTL